MNSRPSFLMILFLLFSTALFCPKVEAGEAEVGKVEVGKNQLVVIKEDLWHGYRRDNFKVEGKAAFVIHPTKPLAGNPWIIRARFFGHEPQADLALLKIGYHLAYCEVGSDFGAPSAVTRWDTFYKLVTKRFQLHPQVALEGMSRGGLIIYNWAIANPEKVACIYADNPVLDIRSWPGGKGKGKFTRPIWEGCLKAYGLTEESLKSYSPPLERLQTLAEHKIPLLHLIGTADRVVPISENTEILETRYKKLGGKIHVIRKHQCGHHPHSLIDPTPIVRFVLEHTGQDPALAGNKNYQVRGSFKNSQIKFTREKKGRVAFIGGSITEMNGYRPMVCDFLKKRFPETEFTFIDAGIASTCSTTGAMRLERDVLSQGPIDLLFVEFAVNDDQDATHPRASCIRGMEGILRQALSKNRLTDIVDTHFINPKMLKKLRAGQLPLTIEAHTRVCHAYHVTTNNLAKEVADRITAGTLTWRQFGGTHPRPAGNQICADMIEEFLTTAWKQPLTPTEKLKPHPMPRRLLDSRSYVNGRFIDINKAERVQGWEIKVPVWSDLQGAKRKRFTSIPMLCATKPGATLKLDFTGKAIGAYLIAGPDAGQVEVSIDGKSFRKIGIFHQHSKALHYPHTVMFAVGLSAGKHQLELRVSKTSSSDGHAVRIMNFTGN